jgi:hypothetical protein
MGEGDLACVSNKIEFVHVGMSRVQIEGRKMKYSDVAVASTPRIQSAVNFSRDGS